MVIVEEAINYLKQNNFREPSDYDFEPNTPFSQIEKKAKELLDRQKEKINVLLGL